MARASMKKVNLKRVNTIATKESVPRAKLSYTGDSGPLSRPLDSDGCSRSFSAITIPLRFLQQCVPWGPVENVFPIILLL